MVCFDINKGDRTASQTVYTHIWANLDVFCFDSENCFLWLFHFQFLAIKKCILMLSMSSCQFLWIFVSYLKVILCFKIFPIGKLEKFREFYSMKVLILGPHINFLTNVFLWYRAFLPRSTYSASVFLVSSINGPRTFFIRCIYGPLGILDNKFHPWASDIPTKTHIWAQGILENILLWVSPLAEMGSRSAPK